jgi:septal ring-binding cell division protein DamX
MVNKYTLGGVVFGIFLLAIMGIRSATNWLTQSNANTTQQDSVLSNTNRVERDSIYRSANQGNDSLNNQNTQVRSRGDGSVELAQNGSPLDEAGSYIQRQKRVEEDAVIERTQVQVSQANGSTPVSAQPNTQVTPSPTPTATPTPTPTRPATASPAVPALW